MYAVDSKRNEKRLNCFDVLENEIYILMEFNPTQSRLKHFLTEITSITH